VLSIDLNLQSCHRYAKSRRIAEKTLGWLKTNKKTDEKKLSSFECGVEMILILKFCISCDGSYVPASLFKKKSYVYYMHLKIVLPRLFVCFHIDNSIFWKFAVHHLAFPQNLMAYSITANECLNMKKSIVHANFKDCTNCCYIKYTPQDKKPNKIQTFTWHLLSGSIVSNSCFYFQTWPFTFSNKGSGSGSESKSPEPMKLDVDTEHLMSANGAVWCNNCYLSMYPKRNP
jgi:hypothetical protein